MNPNHLDSAGKMRQLARLHAAVKALPFASTLYVASPEDGVITIGSVFHGYNGYQAFAGTGEDGVWLGSFSSPTNALAVVQAFAPPGDPRISLVQQ